MDKGDAAFIPRRSGRARAPSARLKDTIGDNALEQHQPVKRRLRRRENREPRVVSELGMLVYATIKLEKLDKSTHKTKGLTKIVRHLHALRDQRWKELWIYTKRHGNFPVHLQCTEFEKFKRSQVVHKLVKIADEYNKLIEDYMGNRGTKQLQPTDMAVGIVSANSAFENIYKQVLPVFVQQQDKEPDNVLMFTKMVDEEFIWVTEHLVDLGNGANGAILEVEDWETPGIWRALHSRGLWLGEPEEPYDMQM